MAEMTEALEWHTTPKSPGRLYQCANDLVPRYEEVQPIVDRIRANLKNFVHLETTVQLLLDDPSTNPTTTTVSVPFEGDFEKIYENLGLIIFQQAWGYYLSADPKGTHHGLTNLVFDGNETSLIRREAEKFLNMLNTRNDLAFRVMKDFHMACEMDEFPRDIYFRESTNKFLDIHLGVRMYTHGEGINRTTVFLPIPVGKEAIDRIYYNLETIIINNLVAFDETHDHYLPVSEELLRREMESLLTRAKKNGNTRKKIVHGLTMDTVLLEDPTMIHHINLADLYYDKINRIDLLDEASARSRELYNVNLIRGAEITNPITQVDSLKMEERVYIDRNTAVGAEPAVITTTPATRPTAAAAPPPAPEEEEEKEVEVVGDGLKPI